MPILADCRLFQHGQTPSGVLQTVARTYLQRSRLRALFLEKEGQQVPRLAFYAPEAPLCVIWNPLLCPRPSRRWFCFDEDRWRVNRVGYFWAPTPHPGLSTKSWTVSTRLNWSPGFVRVCRVILLGFLDDREVSRWSGTSWSTFAPDL